MTLVIDENTPRTGWIHVSKPPVRDGVYETRMNDRHITELREFRNGYWYAAYVDERGTYSMQSLFGLGQLHKHECWRGLAQDPNALKCERLGESLYAIEFGDERN